MSTKGLRVCIAKKVEECVWGYLLNFIEICMHTQLMVDLHTRHNPECYRAKIKHSMSSLSGGTLTDTVFVVCFPMQPQPWVDIHCPRFKNHRRGGTMAS